MKTRKKNQIKRCRGLETVEAAIILPLVMLLTFGAIKYGWIFLKYQQITNITRHAARVASLANTTEDDIKQVISDGMAAARINNYDYSWVTYQAAAGTGYPLTITIKVPATKANNVDILPLKGVLFVPSPDNLTATATMSKEG